MSVQPGALLADRVRPIKGAGQAVKALRISLKNSSEKRRQMLTVGTNMYIDRPSRSVTSDVGIAQGKTRSAQIA